MHEHTRTRRRSRDRRSGQRPRLSWRGVLATGAMFAACAELLLVPQISRYARCATDGIVETGLITEPAGLPDSFHDTVHYVYSVDEKEYSGVGLAGHGNPDVLPAGPALVTYVESDPATSCLGAGWTVSEVVGE